MLRHEAGGGRGRYRAPGVTRPRMGGADLVEHPFEARLDEVPCPHVPRLLLAPHDLGRLETGELQNERLGRERVELLDAEQIDIVGAALLTLLIEVIVDLA